MRIIALFALICSNAAIAADIARPAYTPPVPTSSGSLLQISFSLLLVLAVIMAIAWLLKRMNIAQHGTGNLLKVVGSIAIGQRERVVMIEVEDTWVLIGVGPGQIRTLHTLPKSDNLQDLATSGETATLDNKFASLLSSIIKPRNGNGNAP
ncbi:MAG: flagellar biosynthetic protein FliO [Nitrosomonadales bacterium]